jgi:hypothetical protein
LPILLFKRLSAFRHKSGLIIPSVVHLLALGPLGLEI